MNVNHLFVLVCSFVSSSHGSRSLGFLPGRLMRRDSFRQNERLALAKTPFEGHEVHRVLLVVCCT